MIKKIMMLSTILLGVTSVAMANSSNSFNPKNFASQQTDTMNAESSTFDNVAGQAINDLQTFLDKNPLNDSSDTNKADRNEILKPQHFQFSPSFQQQKSSSKQNDKTQTENDKKNTPNSSALPIVNDNENNNNNNGGWNYQL